MSKRRDVLLAVKALVQGALPLAKVRGFDTDAKRPSQADPGGDVIGHPGDPGEPDIDLSPLTYNYEHAIPLEVGVRSGVADPDAELDVMLMAIGEAIDGDRTLGGLCSFVEAEAPEVNDRTTEGASSLRWAAVTIVAHYSTAGPLA
jgi:hypothetical protein